MIGLFDSGSGGLSVLAALRMRAPRADIVYFGDIAHAPYGVRSAADLAALTESGIAVLKEMGATEIVSACNSVTRSILTRATGPVPVIEMATPTIAGMRAYAGKRALLIATPATIASGIYGALGEFLALDTLAIPELAGAIEFGASRERVSAIVREAFRAHAAGNHDCLLLGCTHYPLALETIEEEAQRVLGNPTIIDPATFVANEVVRRFGVGGAGRVRFRISGDSEPFRQRVRELLGASGYSIEVGVYSGTYPRAA